MNSKQTDKSAYSTMEALLASLDKKHLNLVRGQEVSGEVVSINQNDITLELGVKSEGVISKKDLNPEVVSGLKIGDSIKAFVLIPENESGQVVLTAYRGDLAPVRSFGRNQKSADSARKWQRFIQAQRQATLIKGLVVEINKGGIVLEVDRVRGFLPISQLKLSNLKEAGFKSGALDNLVGQEFTVNVIEVDPSNNRLIFSGQSKLSGDQKAALDKIKEGDVIGAEVGAIIPTGLFVQVAELEGFVPQQEVSWEKAEDLTTKFKVGDQVQAKIINRSEDGRVTLSLRLLSKDPFEEVVGNYSADDVVGGTVTDISQNGVLVELEGGVIGFVPSNKVEASQEYTIGQKTNFLVDGADKPKRRINLAPFITSTVGLIYK